MKKRRKRKSKVDSTELQLQALQAAAEVYRKVRERQKRIERFVIGGIFSFISFIAICIWYTDGKLATDTITFLRKFEGADADPSPSPTLNCMHPRNKKTAYCENRILEQKSSWREITRFGGKANAFPLYGKDK